MDLLFLKPAEATRKQDSYTLLLQCEIERAAFSNPPKAMRDHEIRDLSSWVENEAKYASSRALERNVYSYNANLSG